MAETNKKMDLNMSNYLQK